MRRFFVPPAALVGDEVLLQGEVRHHLCTVLRLGPGDEVELCDGAGTLCRCRLLEVTKKVARARVLARSHQEETAFSLRLIQGLPKADKMDLILQKGTELGVGTFVPLLAERSVARLSGSRELRRLERWRRIAEEAARQCGRAYLPEVVAPQELSRATAGTESLRLMLWEQGSVPLQQALPTARPADAVVLVGPEGGFSAAEADCARAAGFVPVHLGPRILRTETAGPAVAAVLQYLYGDLGSSGAGRSGEAEKESR